MKDYDNGLINSLIELAVIVACVLIVAGSVAYIF
jgi:hypothetical protein